ncbi:hypothetical protein LXL04_018974 [Taraxacum kok-saghyz]
MNQIESDGLLRHEVELLNYNQWEHSSKNKTPKAAPRNEQHKGQNNTKQPQLQAHQSSSNHSSNQQQQPKPAGRTPTLRGKNVNNSHTIRTDLPPTGKKGQKRTHNSHTSKRDLPPTGAKFSKRKPQQYRTAPNAA